MTDEDRQFILDNVNAHAVPEPLAKKHIIAERCGVRPLAVKGEAAAGGTSCSCRASTPSRR